MKSLIVFDSNFGNTKKIADSIAGQLGSGALSISVNDLKDSDLNEIDLLIVGSPINAWSPTKKTAAFLDRLGSFKMNGIKSAAFDTRIKSFISGNAAKKIAKALQQSGADLVVPPVGFYVTDKEGPPMNGEIKKAEGWAQLIKSKL